MRIATYPAHVESLLRFLRRMGFGAQEVDYAVVEVEAEGAARLKVVPYLRIWESVESEREVKIVDGAVATTEPRGPGPVPHDS